jgi:hypothetical protein
MFETEKLPLALAVLALSVLAGVASYLQGRREDRFPSGILQLGGEITSAVVAGVSTLFLGAWLEYPEALTCFTSLIAASNGKEYMSLASKALTEKFNLGTKK